MQCVLSSPALPPSRVPCPPSFPHSHKGGLPTFLHQATTLVHTLRVSSNQESHRSECRAATLSPEPGLCYHLHQWWNVRQFPGLGPMWTSLQTRLELLLSNFLPKGSVIHFPK